MAQSASPTINYTDRSFSHETVENCRLTVQLSFDKVSYLIYYPKNKKFVAFAEFSSNDNQFAHYNNIEKYLQIFRSAMQYPAWNMADFEKVYFLIENRSVTLIPVSLFDNNHMADYLHFNQHINEPLKVLTNKLNHMNAFNVFSIPALLFDSLSEMHNEAVIVHHSSVLIESLLAQYKHTLESPHLFLNIRDGFEDIVVFADKQLKFHNSFEFDTREDFIYYLLFVIEQLNLNPDTLQLVLTGNILRTSNLYEILYKYIRNIRFIERNDQFSYSYVFDDMPQHFNYTLFNLSACEL